MPTPSGTTIDAAVALNSMAVARQVAAQFADDNIALMSLKGPLLQQRLYGTPAAYRSGDFDVLVHASDAARARAGLERAGWRFERENGVLWQVSRAATYQRDGVRLDLHWGLHAAHLPARALRRLERALWASASMTESGLLEPAIEPLVVYLALHAAGHSFERPTWVENVQRAAAHVTDWDAVHAVARESQLTRTLDRALAVVRGERVRRNAPLVDGPVAALTWAASWLLRGHWLPGAIRAQGRALAARIGGRGLARVTFAGLEISLDDGVFPPAAVSEQIVEHTIAAIDRVPSRARPVVIDVGTGSGAIALAVARARRRALVYGIDIDPVAIRSARRNAHELRLRNIRWKQGNLLEPLPDQPIDVIAANVPYVSPDVPTLAGICSSLTHGTGADGLGLVRDVIRDAQARLRPSGTLVLQVADGQWESVRAELVDAGFVAHDPQERRPGRALVVVAQRGA